MSYINKIGKTTAWRKHVLNNLVADTILYGKIETSLTLARSKDKDNLTKLMAKLIKYAKQDTLHSRRMALRYLVNKKSSGVVNKLFTELKERYRERKGGYTRITKLNYRMGDNNLRVIFSLV